MISALVFLYMVTFEQKEKEFMNFVENALVSGWNNIDFIGKHKDEDSPEIQKILSDYFGLYYQWDMGIQCKYEAGVWYTNKNTMNFWTTYESAKNIAFFRLYFKNGRGTLTIPSSQVMSFWENYEEGAFRKYASFSLFETNRRESCYAVGFTKDMKFVPLNFSVR